MFGILFHTVMWVYIYTICFLAARLSVLLLPYYILPFFYHEELSLSCLYIRYCVNLFDFFSSLNLKSGEKSKIPDTLKSSIVFEMTYTCIHIFFLLFFTTKQFICFMLLKYWLFSSVLCSLSMFQLFSVFSRPTRIGFI